jgi:hypothetical protein
MVSGLPLADGKKYSDLIRNKIKICLEGSRLNFKEEELFRGK